jgi:hypothetical protein
MDTNSPTYRKAFIDYLRYGIPPIDLEHKTDTNEHPTTHYIWRTRGDDKVRPTHAANNGRIFAWDNPPGTGNPGEDYGCRCTAEPYHGTDIINDPPIEPAYPELVLIPLLRLRESILLAANIIRRLYDRAKLNKPEILTEHGAVRSAQRRTTVGDAEEAIRTAKKTGDFVTKIGKYGTLQIHYKGSNGVTVIVETVGRNAGKIITFWWTK